MYNRIYFGGLEWKNDIYMMGLNFLFLTDLIHYESET